MYTVTQLIRRLRSPDNKLVLQAVEELRAQGWLSDGTLGGVNLRHAHLQGTDLFKANLEQVDLGMADLRWADLSLARLQGARLVRANLYKADFSLADLRGVDLFKANLQEARNLTDKQLARAYRLWGATMPDGSLYDGRFNLVGDVGDARLLHVDTNDPRAMADFYGVSVEDYLYGQERAEEHSRSVWYEIAECNSYDQLQHRSQSLRYDR